MPSSHCLAALPHTLREATSSLPCIPESPSAVTHAVAASQQDLAGAAAQALPRHPSPHCCWRHHPTERSDSGDGLRSQVHAGLLRGQEAGVADGALGVPGWEVREGHVAVSEQRVLLRRYKPCTTLAPCRSKAATGLRRLWRCLLTRWIAGQRVLCRHASRARRGGSAARLLPSRRTPKPRRQAAGTMVRR